MLIGLIGKKQVGKDTFGQIVTEHYGFQKRAFADPIKECCQLLFQLREEQLHDPVLKETIVPQWNETPRQMMQRIGTDLFRNHYDPQFWIKVFQSWYEEQRRQSMHTSIVCTDIRFQNEAECIRSLGGILIRIQRPLNTQDDLHESEQLCISTELMDYEIINDSTLESFQNKIHELLPTILG